MKRLAMTTQFILILMILMLAFSACNQAEQPEVENPSENSMQKLSVICTVFPAYDWVQEILGSDSDNIDVRLLLSSGVDMHSYQPTVDDIVKISTCDLFIYVGGESDMWVDEALQKALNPDMVVINLMDILGDAAKLEEISEGMEEEKKSGGDENPVYDEHVWLSLKNTELFCSRIADALLVLDSGNADAYRNNLAVYTEKISALDKEYQILVDESPVKTLLFGDRFPCRYLVDDYGINYYAAFPGCSAETEASFETIVFLAKKMDELSLKSIMVTESSDQTIAKTIINNTKSKNQQILVLNSMQSVTFEEMKESATWLSIMESNLNVLKEALN